MALAQSSPTPPDGTGLRKSDLGWALRYCLRGLFELLRARWTFARLQAADIPRRNRAAAQGASPSRCADPEAAVARIGYVLPRISSRVPWRSDCLVQALAAQNWLSSLGLAGEIRIGVEQAAGTGFGAHAWIMHGDTIVTGGDVSRYHLLLSENGRDDPQPSRDTIAAP